MHSNQMRTSPGSGSGISRARQNRVTYLALLSFHNLFQLPQGVWVVGWVLLISSNVLSSNFSLFFCEVGGVWLRASEFKVFKVWCVTVLWSLMRELKEGPSPLFIRRVPSMREKGGAWKSPFLHIKNSVCRHVIRITHDVAENWSKLKPYIFFNGAGASKKKARIILIYKRRSKSPSLYHLTLSSVMTSDTLLSRMV